MATMLKEVDAVCIGVGFTGSILARELTKAGLHVVGLERGANRSAREDFTLPSVRDDLKYAIRQELLHQWGEQRRLCVREARGFDRRVGTADGDARCGGGELPPRFAGRVVDRFFNEEHRTGARQAGEQMLGSLEDEIPPQVRKDD